MFNYKKKTYQYKTQNGSRIVCINSVSKKMLNMTTVKQYT